MRNKAMSAPPIPKVTDENREVAKQAILSFCDVIETLQQFGSPDPKETDLISAMMEYVVLTAVMEAVTNMTTLLARAYRIEDGETIMRMVELLNAGEQKIRDMGS